MLRVIVFGIILVGLLAACNIGWSIMKNGMPAQVQPASSPVPMLQPSGWNPQTDNLNSETNRNNAEANELNAQAQLNLAQATAVVADSNQGPINTYKDGRSEGLGAGFGIGVVGFVVLAFIAFLIIAALR